MKTAFVLGGGGVLGAHEVGMLRALAGAGIAPDVVVGTSVGAINGAFVAADPAGAAARLARLWQGGAVQRAFSGTLWGRAVQLASSGTDLHAIGPLHDMLRDMLPAADFDDLELPFQCVAASIERAQAHWFSSGPLVPAVLASCAVPGLLPPVEIGGEHFFDGGLRLADRGDRDTVHVPGAVDSQRIRRAVAYGAFSEPSLRDHALVPRPHLPRRYPDIPGGGRDRRAGTDGRGKSGPAGPPGHRAQPAMLAPVTHSCSSAIC